MIALLLLAFVLLWSFFALILLPIFLAKGLPKDATDKRA